MLLTSAQSFMNCSWSLPRLPLQLLVMFFSICQTQQNRVPRKMILQCRDQVKFSINCKDFRLSIGVETFVLEPNGSLVRLFFLVLHEIEGRGECGVQCGGTDDVQERQTVFVCLVDEIQD